MSNQKDIAEEIVLIESLRTLVRAYEEIASIRMRKTRDSVVKNRQFQSEINDIFEQVRASYAKEVNELARKKGKKGAKTVTFLAHNGKTVAVLLSANTGLYGDIVQKTFEQFMSEVNIGKSEVTVVGRHGLSLFLEKKPNHPYTYFTIPDHGIKSENLDEVIKHIVQYEEIHVYYGEFLNVIKQKPASLTISAEISLKEDEGTMRASYIFEPTLEKILKFFETEIFASLFEQSVREGQLAKFASRVLAMTRADENIGKRMTNLKFEKQRIAHRLVNRKQLNSLAPKMRLVK